MVSKNEIKYIQTLYHKKTRDEENVFIAEGPKLIDELLQSNFKIKRIFATNDRISSTDEIPVTVVTDEELKKISRLETPNRVLAIVEKKKQKGTIDLKNRLTLLLDGIQDPGNMGTIIRIADWFGITDIVATKDSADCYNPKTVQSTMGSIFRINVSYVDAEDFLKKNTVKVFGAMLHGKNIREYAPIEEGIIVIGNESKGIRENIQGYINEKISIPSFGKAESLNAAVAAGIILSHIVK